jgi:hypothetical protein
MSRRPVTVHTLAHLPLPQIATRLGFQAFRALAALVKAPSVVRADHHPFLLNKPLRMSDSSSPAEPESIPGEKRRADG